MDDHTAVHADGCLCKLKTNARTCMTGEDSDRNKGTHQHCC